MRTTISLLAALTACGDDPVKQLPDAAPMIDAALDSPPNAAPTAMLAPGALAQTAGLQGQVARLAGAGTDPEGAPLTFAWTQTAGPPVALTNATTATATFIPRRVGMYTFALVVGDGVQASAPVPVTYAIHDLDGGEDFSLALKPDGTLLAWGANGAGSLGNNLLEDRPLPGRVCDTEETDCTLHPFTGAVAIATGRGHALALKDDGSVWAWGDDLNGQLGRNTDLFQSVWTPYPVCAVGGVDCNVTRLQNVVQIAAGYEFSVALRADGTVVAWGRNVDGQLGDGTQINRTVPVRVCAPGQVEGTPCTAFLSDVVQLAAGGGGHTLAITSTGQVYGWGHNKNGQVGNGASSSQRVTIPVQIAFDDVAAVDAWSGHSLGLKRDGSLWAWGSNDTFELGQVTSVICFSGQTCAELPSPVCTTNDAPCTTPFGNVASFSAGRRFSVAVGIDGSAWSWGDNLESQLGDGTATTPRPSPGRVCEVGTTAPCATSLSLAAIATGSYHALGLRADGSLVAWGDDDFGQLGDDATLADRTVPVVVPGY